MKRNRNRAAGVLTAALAALLLLAATAQASPPVTIAGLGQGAGQVDNPEGVAVDQASGDLYVADRNNFRIDKFDSAGEFALAWGWGVADGTSQELQVCGPAATPPTKRCFAAPSSGSPGAVIPEAVAVDQSSHAVYVTDTINRRVSKFSPAGEFLFMVGKGVNQGGGTPSTPGNLCTAQHLADGDVCGAGQSASGAGEFFANPQSLAIDPAGHLWVGEIDRVIQFDGDGAYLSEAALPGGGVTRAFGIDPVSGDFYLESTALNGAHRYVPSGTPINTLTMTDTIDAAGAPQSLGVDATGNLYLADCGGPPVSNICPGPFRFKIFNPAGEQVSQFGAGQVNSTSFANSGPRGALAVDDATNALYVAIGQQGAVVGQGAVKRFTIPEPGPLPDNQRAEEIEPTTVTLAAGLNPEGNQTTYRFEYGTTDSYGLSTEAKTLPGTGFDDEEVKAGLTELIPGTTYHFRLVATNHCKPAEPSVECTVAGPDTTFTTLPAVAIEAQWATGVSAGDATLHAELNPLGVAGEWWIEYGTSPCSGGGCEETAESALPASFGAIPVATALSGLEPSTTYHYRFAARDERDGTTYVVHGEDRSFTTQLGGLGFALPDDRAWEMVSPPQKFGGAVAGPGGEGQVQAAAGGDAIAYLSRNSIEAEPEGNRAPESSSVLARRAAGGSWGSKDITPPNTSVTPLSVGFGREYKLFSPDLASVLLEPRSGTPLSPIASERTPYLRDNSGSGAFTPLVTGKEGFANVPPGTVFGGDLAKPNPDVHVKGATAELEHVVLKSDVPLAAGAVAEGLYEWLAGRPPEEQLLPVSRLPAGNLVSGDLGSGPGSVRGAISADGSRVFWSTMLGDTPTALYLRDTGLEETIRLDVVQPGATGSGLARPIFQGADVDGTVAFFTDTRQLTDDSGASFDSVAGKDKPDLYRCEIVREGGEDKCLLENLTPEGDGGKAAEVLGLAPGIGEDGSHVYFFARGVLDTLPNAQGEGAVAGRPNLYLWREGEGTRFIATLAEGDRPDWGVASGAPMANALTATASPSGRYLAFMSERPLTGYDNRDADSGEPAQEVFRFDAQANGGAGGLVCASCNPAGARPAGRLPGTDDSPLPGFDPLQLWEGRVLAATLPEATRNELGGVSLYRARAIHDNGRVFFNAIDSLAPADSNGDWDVYEFEPSGDGDCGPTSGSAGVSLSAGGCVALISAGTGEGQSAFLDASEGGDDVFFLTEAQLSVLDEDHVTDVYDARAGGTTATLVPRTECLGEACQPAARASGVSIPAAFKGAGNVAPKARKRCPRSKRRVTRKGKSRCVVRASKRKRGARR